MTRSDWTQPPFGETPGDLGAALLGSRLAAVENDRATRTVRLRFVLPTDAGPPEATFEVRAATHLLGFAYLPPAESLPEGQSPEEAMAAVGDWARQGLIVSADPFSFGTALAVQRAILHPSESATTFSVEGYGEDADLLVWWEVRVSGAVVEAS